MNLFLLGRASAIWTRKAATVFRRLPSSRIRQVAQCLVLTPEQVRGDSLGFEDFHPGVSENGVAVEYVQGRQHEVEVFYELNPVPDYLHNVLQTILRLHVESLCPEIF